jgi:hypothetical protein
VDGVTVSGAGSGEPGISVLAGEVDVRALTVRGPDVGAFASRVADGDLSSLYLRGAALEGWASAGLIVRGSGVSVAVQDSDVRAASDAAGADALAVTVEGGGSLVARDLRVEAAGGSALRAEGEGTVVSLEATSLAGDPARPPSAGVELDGGASLYATGLSIGGVAGRAAAVRDEGSVLELDEAEISGISCSSDGAPGVGAGAWNGALLVMRGGLVDSVPGLGVVASGLYSGADLDDVELRTGAAPTAATGGTLGAGVLAEDGGHAEALRLVVDRGEGPGLLARAGGRVDCWNCVLGGCLYAGAAAVEGGIVVLEGGSVADARRDLSGLGGAGLLGIGENAAPVLEAYGLTLAGHEGPAALLRGLGAYRLEGVLVDGVATAGGPAAPAAILARDGVDPSGLLLVDSGITHRSGDGVLLHAASATLQAVWFEEGPGVDLRQQECGPGVEPPLVTGGEPTSLVCEGAPVELGEAAPLPDVPAP